MIRRIRFVVLYLLFLFAVFETSSRLFLSLPATTDRLLAEDDLSRRRSWVQRHRSGAEVYYAFDAYDPTQGWIAKPNLRDEQAGPNWSVSTNSRGLRGKTEYAYEKTAGKLRALVLGDSFTFGDEVGDNETYSYYLQQLLPQIEVINMGVHGYGHDQMLILFKEEGVKYQPDIVILGFLEKDMARNLLEFRDYAKPKFVMENGQLALRGSPVPRPEQVLEWDWARPRTVDILSAIVQQYRVWSGLDRAAQVDITMRILDEIVGVVQSIRATPIFVYLPTGREIADPDAATEGEQVFFSLCRSIRRVRCFSSRPQFTEQVAQGKTFKVKGHWEPLGHVTAAAAMHRFLVDGAYLIAPGSAGAGFRPVARPARSSQARSSGHAEGPFGAAGARAN